jgi:type I restriction enzyme S subunit
MNPYSDYKPSGVEWIGEIPSHWKRTRLRNLGEFYGGLSGKGGDDFKQDDNPNNRPYIPYTNILRNTYISKTHFDYVVLEEGEVQNRVQRYDMFFLMSSETHEDLGKSSILIEEVEELYLNSFCKGFRIDQEEVYPLFLNYQLLGQVFKELISVEGKGFTRINLRQDRLKDVPVLLPPLPEQEEIVRYLDTKTQEIDQLVSITEKKIDLLKERRTSTINEVVTKGLNPNVERRDSGVEWIGEIPSHWEVKKLKYVCEIVYGISPPDTTYNDEGIGTILINGPVEYSESDFGYTRSLKWTTDPKKFTEKGSLLFCMRGSTTGRMNITHTDVSIGRGVCSIISKENQWYMIYSMFLVRMWIQEQLSGSTFPSVTSDDVDNYLICSPPLTEQEEIVRYLDTKTQEIDQLVSIEENRIKTLKEYRQSLISEVVTGKVKVTSTEPIHEEG